MIAIVLAAGMGKRLRPLTDSWPKCLMPIHERPLLEYWLSDLFDCGIEKVLINTHYHSQEVLDFLARDCFKGRINVYEEPELLGTAGTIRSMAKDLNNGPTLVLHADNWVDFDLHLLLKHHHEQVGSRKEYSMSMLTFNSENPSSAGVVVCDCDGIVNEFFEKVENPPSDVANGAIYVLEADVIDWLVENPEISDFSVQVIPQFLGRIGTLHNNGIHRDIGTVEALSYAQNDPFRKNKLSYESDDWSEKFKKNRIHKLIELANSELCN